MWPLVVGALLAVASLAFVLQPLLSGKARGSRRPPAQAGSVPGDAEIEAMIERYRSARPECPTCGLRPEPDAVFCTECGRALPGRNASALDEIQPLARDVDRDEGRS